jgi:hypothetical protein
MGSEKPKNELEQPRLTPEQAYELLGKADDHVNEATRVLDLVFNSLAGHNEISDILARCAGELRYAYKSLDRAMALLDDKFKETKRNEGIE